MLVLRSNTDEGRELLAYIQDRTDRLRVQLGGLLLDERKSDTLRGRIAELQNLREAVENKTMGDEA